jgi:hypothetical protein
MEDITMASTTVPPAAPQYKSHRRAFGSHRVMSPAVKARNIAESIALRLDEGRAWSYADYGIAEKPEMITLVEAALAQL